MSTIERDRECVYCPLGKVSARSGKMPASLTRYRCLSAQLPETFGRRQLDDSLKRDSSLRSSCAPAALFADRHAFWKSRRL